MFSDESPGNAQQSQPDPRPFTNLRRDSRHNRPDSFAWHNRDHQAYGRDHTVHHPLGAAWPHPARHAFNERPPE